MIGRTIGKYRIVGQIGRGATGVVYKAVDETLSREVAIKVLHADVADTEILRRFRVEATTLAKLNHPEIATIHELLPTETDLLMVMEFVRGETLEKLSNRLGPMPPDHAAYLTGRVLSALEYAHRAGIVHRDMKPANVMVTDVGGIKIMDFGTARVRGAEHMTVDGSVLGTPAYMAPEQVLGRDVDGRADLYSVGVVFYRLLTGALPFEADTAIGMMQRQISEPPVPLHVRRDGLPHWCEAILERALVKSPADRFQTAQDFREALDRATGRVTIDVASAFVAVESDVTTPPQPVTLKTVAISRTEVPSSAALRAGGGTADPDASKTGSPPPVSGPGVSWIASGMTIVRKPHLAWAGSIVVVAALLAVVAYVALRRAGTEPMAAATLPPVVFETKALVRTAGAQRERDARLVLADGKITVSATDDARRTLRSVPYESVTSISYSRGRDPMWNSPDGPARVARAGGGVLGKWGIFVERHWISLRTETDDGFVILRVNDEQVRKVLTALEERTGRTAQRVAELKSAR